MNKKMRGIIPSIIILLCSANILAETGVNIALNKTATAQTEDAVNHPASYVVDSDANSYWGANPYPSWWQVDLGQDYTVDTIRVTNYSDGSRYYQYNVESSTDGTTWTQVASKSDTAVATTAGDTYALTATARYFRVNMTHNSANTGVHIRDFYAEGTATNPIVNIALNKTATAEDTESGFPASNAVDSDANSYWGGRGYPKWWQVDLGEKFDITSIRLTNYYDGTRYYQYDIESSEDGTTWNSVASKTNTLSASSSGDTYTVATTARYLKVNSTYNSANNSVHIRDFHVEGTVFDPAPASATYYISSADGIDTNPGTLSSPFKTLEKARNAIRAMKTANTIPAGGVIVYLRGGTYTRDSSFTLSSLDAATVSKPVVYKAYENEVPVLIGGKELTASNFTVVTDATVLARMPTAGQGKVYQIDLAAESISQYAAIKKIGFGWDKKSLPPILQVDGKDQTLARYPNNSFMTINSVTSTGSIPRNGDVEPWTGASFTYSDARADSWANAPDMWVFGYWFWDWADGNLQVSSLDANTNTISSVGPSWYGVKAGQRFYAYNLLEEIDQPGEYYIDRTNNILYLYPQNGANITSSRVKLGLLETPLIDIDNVKYTTFEGIHFDLTTGKGVQINNSSNVLVKGNKFTNIGLWAVSMGDQEAAFDGTRLLDPESGGGRNNGAIDNLMYDLYAGGISIMGGNRNTLEAANNYAENNHIYNYAQFYRTYNPAISLNGVGNRAVSNEIHNAPHQAIQFLGNDLLIEKNEIYDVLKETDDSGAIYSARDWTYQGNLIKHNYLHTFTHAVTYALYFDDLMSSAEVFGNVIEGVPDYAILNGGGRGSIIHNNIFINSANAGYYDSRGTGWANAVTLAPDGTCYQALLYVPYTAEPWASRYPLLVDILTDDRAKPKYLTLKNNVMYNTSAANISANATADALDISKNINYTTDPGFVSLANKNWELLPTAQVYTDIPDFEHIPFNDIGLAHPTPFLPPVAPVVETFSDDFENGTANWDVVKGSGITSTTQAHGGTASYLVNNSDDVISTVFGNSLNKTATIWFYDNSTDTSSAVVARVDDNVSWRGIGVNTNTSSSKYVTRVGGTWAATTVSRTTGWHELKWDYTSGTDVKMYIDGILIKTEAGVISFNYLAMGDWWSGIGSINYFDDVDVQ